MNSEELFKKGNKLRDNNELEESRKIYQEIIDKGLGDELLRADALHMLGLSFAMGDEKEEGAKVLQKAKEEFLVLGEKMRVGAVLRDLGSVYKDKGKARKSLEESVEVLEETEFLGHLGISQVKLGVFDSDEEKILEGISNIEKSEDEFFLATAYMNLGEVYLKKEKKDEASKSFEKALEKLNKIAGEDEHLRMREKIDKLLKKI